MVFDSKPEKQWCAVFPASVEKESDSVLFLSRMTYIAFAEYLLHRGIVPSAAFSRRRIGGAKGVIFHTFNKTHWGAKISDMLKGIGDAIKLKYARQAIIMINEDKRDPDLATEVFCVSFAYNDEDCLKITDERGNTLVSLGYKDKPTFRKQVAYIIKKIGLANQSLAKLEGDITPFFKLTYFDERTPPEYEPMHFQKCKRAFYFDYPPPKYDFGSITTEHAAMLFDIKSLYIENAMHLDEVMLTGEINYENELMDTTVDADMTMADLDQNSSPDGQHSSPYNSEQRTPSLRRESPNHETPRDAEVENISPKTPSNVQKSNDGHVSDSEASGGNDTTHEDLNSSPQVQKETVKSKKQLAKKKSPIQKKSPVKMLRVYATRNAKKKKAAAVQEGSDDGTSQTSQASSGPKFKVSQRRVSPPTEQDSTPLRKKSLEGEHFKTSVALRSFLKSPGDPINYFSR